MDAVAEEAICKGVDSVEVVAEHNMGKPEFWADMADAFLNDPDARKGKLARYYWDIVGH